VCLWLFLPLLEWPVSHCSGVKSVQCNGDVLDWLTARSMRVRDSNVYVSAAAVCPGMSSECSGVLSCHFGD